MNDINMLDAEWFTVDQPWGDGDWIVAGNPDPHAGEFIVMCDPMIDVPEDVPSPQQIAARIVDDHNKATKLTHYEALRKAARELIKDPGFHTEDKLREALTALEAAG